MKAIIFGALFTVFLFASGTSDVFACSCDLPLPVKSLEKQIKESYKKSAAIFSGKVIEVIKIPNAYFVKVKFKSEKIYKGEMLNEIIVSTGLGNGDCGYRFEVGKSYLIYAYGDSDNLLTNICQRTSLLQESKDAEILDKKKRKKN